MQAYPVQTYPNVVCPLHTEAHALANGLAFYFAWLCDEYSGKHEPSRPDALLYVQALLGTYSEWLLGGRERLQDALLECWRRERQSASQA